MAALTKIRDAGNTLRTMTEIYFRDATNTSRRVRFIKVRDGANTLRTVFESAAVMTAAAAPPTVYGSTLGTGTATTDTTTVTPTGGTAPYTYAWSLISYDNSVPPTATAATAATSAFTQTSIAIGEANSAVWRCTVTDDESATATADISAFWTDTT